MVAMAFNCQKYTAHEQILHTYSYHTSMYIRSNKSKVPNEMPKTAQNIEQAHHDSRWYPIMTAKYYNKKCATAAVPAKNMAFQTQAGSRLPGFSTTPVDQCPWLQRPKRHLAYTKSLVVCPSLGFVKSVICLCFSLRDCYILLRMNKWT